MRGITAQLLTGESFYPMIQIDMKTEDESDKGIWKGLFSWLRGKSRKGVPPDIEAAIHQLIDAGEEKGVIHEDEGEMIESIFEFRDTAAREIMVPRTDMVAIDSKAPILQVIQLIRDKGHSKIPVYENNLDNILGILHVKDLLKYWGQLDISLNQIIRPPIFIPETKKVGDLLRDLRGNKASIAIVLDEYGGTSGLVTIEDIVEEIVGEIQDEHDIEEQRIIEIDANTAVADGRLDVKELEHHFDAEIPEGRFESLGGFITHILGKVPKVNETIRFRNLEFTIESADERRIQRVRIKKVGWVTSESAAGN